MVGYILKLKHLNTCLFYASWKELVETLEEMENPKSSYTIEPCIYYESDFKGE